MSNSSNSTETTCGAAEDEDTPAFLLILGILLGLSASIGINLGNNMQSLGMAQQAASGQERKNKTFWIGTSMFAIASIINFAAFGFAPASTLAPLESVQFVTNLLFARFVNKKVVTPKMVLGSALIVSGTIVAIVVAPSGVAKFCIHDLTEFWVAPGWIWYLVIVATLAAALLITHEVYQRALFQGKKYRGYRLVLPITYAVSSALAGSQCVVQAKSMSELFELIVTGDWSTITHWFFWFNLVLLMIFLVTWLYRMNMALKKYDPLFIIPLLQSNYILFSTVTGGIYFQEFALMADSDFPWFFSGIAIMFFGLGLLAPTSGSDDSDVTQEDSKDIWTGGTKEADAEADVSDVGQQHTMPRTWDGNHDHESMMNAGETPEQRKASISRGREMDPAEAEDFFSDVLGPGPLRNQSPIQPTADLALSMALQTPVQNRADSPTGTEDPGSNITDDDVQVTVVSAMPVESVADGTVPNTLPRRRSSTDARRCGCGVTPELGRAESASPAITQRSIETNVVSRTDWPLAPRDISSRSERSLVKQSSTLQRPVSGSGTSQRMMSTASRMASSQHSSIRRPSTIGRQSQRMRQTSNAMPEPALFGFLDLFGGTQNFSTAREGSLPRDRAGASHTSAPSARMYSTAPASGGRSATRPDAPAPLADPPQGAVVLKPEAIELAKRMDNV